MMTDIRFLFWDFDGTLYDTYPGLLRAFMRTQEALGVKNPIGEKEALGLMKVTLHNAFARLAERAGMDVGYVAEAFQAHRAENEAFPPYEGVEEALRALRGAGIRHHLYTHRDQTAVRQLQADGLWQLFDGGITQEDGFPYKPAPDALLYLMEREGIMPRHAAMVGDRDIDIQAGHNAGMRGILFDPDHFYPTLAAESRVRSMAELAALLLRARP